MKRFFLVFLVLAWGALHTVHGQDFNTKFGELFEKKDVAGQQKVLRDWEKTNPNDPELYVAYFNHYFIKSRKEILSLTSKPVSKDSMKITKEEDGTVAYLGSQFTFNKEDFDTGVSYIDKGVEKFPNRLDMRFGKVYAFGQIEDFRSFTREIVKTIDYSGVNNNQWLWMMNKPVREPGKKFMLDAVQDYIGQLYGAGDENAENIKTIAEAVLKHYPDSVENLSNLAVFYLIKKDFDNALVPLLKAEKLAPTDFIVLNNIAFSYYSKGDKANAVKYYELVLKYGSADAKTQAQDKITELKKQK